jgi:hypothetical protein
MHCTHYLPANSVPLLYTLQANSSSSASTEQQQQQQQSKGYAHMLSSLGVAELSRLLAAASQLGLQQPLMDQLARFLQVGLWYL